jgi:hypothetical protein
MVQQIHKRQFGLVPQAAGRFFGEMRSENFGGLVSMVGSCLFLLGGDASGVVISLSFLAAEITLARSGHTRAGYSFGCALFSFGDALATTSQVAHGNPAFQITLAAMAAAWLLGALRAPVAWLGELFGKTRLVAAADALQPIVGIVILVLRLPGIATAATGTNYLGAAAVGLWAASDILVGRLQFFVRKISRKRSASPSSSCDADTLT